MDHKTIVITGASDGIGAAAAQLLKISGARVVIVGRSLEKTKRVATAISAPYYIADFARLDDVHALAARLSHDYPRIDILINNAGGIMGKRQLTVDGYEKTFQVNYLAPFLLTQLLLPTLLRSKATIINTSSIANIVFSKFDIHDLQLVHAYTPNKAYGNAKLANILFTRELHRRYHTAGIASVAFHPGNVATNFADKSTSLLWLLYRTPLKKFLLTPQEGADTLVWLATTQEGNDWTSGEYYDKRRPTQASTEAYNTGLASQLWKRSLAMVGTPVGVV